MNILIGLLSFVGGYAAHNAIEKLQLMNHLVNTVVKYNDANKALQAQVADLQDHVEIWQEIASMGTAGDIFLNDSESPYDQEP